jgi:hypothetical protein
MIYWQNALHAKTRANVAMHFETYDVRGRGSSYDHCRGSFGFLVLVASPPRSGAAIIQGQVPQESGGLMRLLHLDTVFAILARCTQRKR